MRSTLRGAVAIGSLLGGKACLGTLQVRPNGSENEIFITAEQRVVDAPMFLVTSVQHFGIVDIELHGTPERLPDAVRNKKQGGVKASLRAMCTMAL